MANGFRPSEGTYLFVLGLVVIIASPDRFWLGFAFALIPILIGAIGKAVATARRPTGSRDRGRKGAFDALAGTADADEAEDDLSQ